jgi:GNAT superfamily N-acetyltransferase
MSEGRGAVATLGPERWSEVSDVLAAAFTDDPVFGWLLPDPPSRPAALRRFFTIEGRSRALPLGSSVAATGDDGGVVGAALVIPPGHTNQTLWFQVRHGLGYARVFGRRLAHADRLQNALARVHPTTPHVYLFAIGVQPDAQGEGMATAMLASVLAQCDAEGLPAYLEATTPRNARLYRRLGFETDDILRLEDAPPLELMTRAPR